VSYTGLGNAVFYPIPAVRFHGLKRLDESSPEPVTLAEVKLQRREVPENIEDQYLTELIVAARRAMEDYTHRALKPITASAHFAHFGQSMELPLPPLTAITSITYRDTDNASQTLDPADYTLETSTLPGVVMPAYNTSFPSTVAYGLPVVITYSCGYANLPEPLKQYLMMLVGHMYENREVTSTLNIREVPISPRILDAYRIFRS